MCSVKSNSKQIINAQSRINVTCNKAIWQETSNGICYNVEHGRLIRNMFFTRSLPSITILVKWLIRRESWQNICQLQERQNQQTTECGEQVHHLRSILSGVTDDKVNARFTKVNTISSRFHKNMWNMRGQEVLGQFSLTTTVCKEAKLLLYI